MLIKQGYVEPDIENTPEGFYKQYQTDQSIVDAVEAHGDTVKSIRDSHINDAEAWAKENGDELYDEASGEYQDQAEQKVRMALESGDYKTAQRELDWLRDHANQITTRDENIKIREKESAEVEKIKAELKEILDQRWTEALRNHHRFMDPLYSGDLVAQLKLYDPERFEQEGLQKQADMAIRNLEQFLKPRGFFGPLIPPKMYIMSLIKILQPESFDDFKSDMKPGQLENEIQELMLDLGGHPRQALLAVMDLRSLKAIDAQKYEQIVNSPKVKAELEHLADYCSHKSHANPPFMARALKDLLPNFEYDQVRNLKDLLYLAKDGRDLARAYGAANILLEKDKTEA